MTCCRLVTNVFLLIPGLPLLVILAAFLPPGLGTVILVLVITGWAGAARVIRAQALSIRGKDFVAASIVTGERALRIMFREILPNMASIVMMTLLGCVIFASARRPAWNSWAWAIPTPSRWGTNLFWATNDGALMPGSGGSSSPPVCHRPVAFALALCNYAVDEITNPRLRKPRRAASANAPTVVTIGVTGKDGAA